MATLRTCDVPVKAGPGIWIRRLAASEQVHITVFSPVLQGIWIHWNGNCSEPCTSPTKECAGHKRQLPSKQRFFMHVFNHKEQAQEFLELPSGAAGDLMKYFPKGSSMRGSVLQIKRGAGRTAHLKITFLPANDVSVMGPLPQAKDVHSTLCQLWGLDPETTNWTKENDIPDLSLVG